MTRQLGDLAGWAVCIEVREDFNVSRTTHLGQLGCHWES